MRYLLILLLLSGCAYQRAADARQAQSDLVGLGKADILACMGAPFQSAQSGGLEVLSYSSTKDRVDYNFGVAGPFPETNDTVYGVGTSRKWTRDCRVSVVLENGVVRRVNYAGRTGGLLTKGSQCFYAVENCL